MDTCNCLYTVVGGCVGIIFKYGYTQCISGCKYYRPVWNCFLCGKKLWKSVFRTCNYKLSFWHGWYGYTFLPEDEVPEGIPGQLQICAHHIGDYNVYEYIVFPDRGEL